MLDCLRHGAAHPNPEVIKGAEMKVIPNIVSENSKCEV